MELPDPDPFGPSRLDLEPRLPAETPLVAELRLASELARQAGRLQMERYERLERIVHKSAHDVVTEVDQLSEDLIIAGLLGQFPGDAILAEESGHSTHESSNGRLWVIDPLDGTVNYANGIPIFCVSIGLAIDGEPAVAALYDPVRDELFGAIRGAGAWLGGNRIRHLPKEKLSDAVIAVSLPRVGFGSRHGQLLQEIRVSRDLGSAALSLAWVANGRFDAYLQPRGLALWDVAAAGLIVEESGARITNGAGEAWFDATLQPRDVGIVASSAMHHDRLMELLR